MAESEYELLEKIGRLRVDLSNVLRLTCDVLGQGSFGVVHKVRRKSDGKVTLFACTHIKAYAHHEPPQILCRKEINYASMDQKTRVMLQTELSILSSLQHPNVVSYHQREHHKSSQSVHLYMEYCRNGDLASMISELRRKNEIATEDFVWNVFAQLASALYRCHYGMDAPDVGRNAAAVGRHARPTSADGKPLVTILHRDLKPDNSQYGRQRCTVFMRGSTLTVTRSIPERGQFS